jgi:GT2 family glycosyltransferase
LGRGEALCDTIRMLLRQTRSLHEIIIVDQSAQNDARTQGTLATWAHKGLIQWLWQTEPNASKARNVGALVATGEVLLFLDDDIRISSDFVSTYAETFRRTGAPGVCGQILEGQGKIVTKLDSRVFVCNLGWLVHFPKNYGCECETSFMMSGNVAIRRKIFLSMGGMDENYKKGAHREESDFAMRFRKAGHKFWYNPNCSIYHLGPAVVPGGGARSWSQGRDFHYLHHCVGDWYFSLKFFTPSTAWPLLVASLRHFVFNRHSLNRPWRLPFALAYWSSAFPLAVALRLRGPRLLARNTAKGLARAP